MRLLVCVKQVAEPEALVKIDDSSPWITTDPSIPLRMNRFDEFAMEESILIKETHADTIIDVVTVGPDRAGTVLTRALGMGADKGIHILTQNEGYESPFVIATWIASYAARVGYDLILAGIMAEDDMQGQVGPMIAEILSMPCATSVLHERVSVERGVVYVEREMERGFRDALELRLPAVLTVQSGINKPRYPSLSNYLRAKKQPSQIIDARSLGVPLSRDVVVGVAYPVRSRAGLVLDGTPQQKAVRLVEILAEKALTRGS